MIDHNLDTAKSILYVRPKSALKQDDFENLTKTVDAYLGKSGSLAGLIVEVDAFPGWENLGAMAAHFRFLRDHHKLIRKVCVVTDSAMGNVAENLATHFVSAEIRHFPAGQVAAAEKWILDRG